MPPPARRARAACAARSVWDDWRASLVPDYTSGRGPRHRSRRKARATSAHARPGRVHGALLAERGGATLLRRGRPAVAAMRSQIDRAARADRLEDGLDHAQIADRFLRARLGF